MIVILSGEGRCSEKLLPPGTMKDRTHAARDISKARARNERDLGAKCNAPRTVAINKDPQQGLAKAPSTFRTQGGCLIARLQITFISWKEKRSGQ